ncbi:MAG TPA: amidase [Castellaniella sp.]|nr:amidase [Castellaniella sp.]
MDFDILRMPLRELAQRVSGGELAAVDIATAFIEQVQSHAALDAWQFFDADGVIRQARAIDAQGADTPLAGVPLGVKDLMDTADMPTTYGSPIYAGHRPQRDAACVALARQLGAVIMGKTVTTEFAAFQPGPTRNPCSPPGQVHTPGGSSSGSAAAVAAGMVPIALGTQTARSIVRPAAFCGVVGYKPTFGTISGVGVKALSPSLDTVGAFARRVDDLAWFVSALTHGSLALQAISGLRVGVCRGPFWDQADQDTQRVFDQGILAFEQAGARVSDVQLPDGFHALNDAQIVIMAYEAAAAFAPDAQAHAEGFSPAFEALLSKGRMLTAEAYSSARRLGMVSAQALTSRFDSFDVLLAPSTIGEAPLGLAATGDPVFNRMWSLLGNPCIHMPIGTGAGGMPVGVTVVGALHDDARALSAAWMLEQVAPSTAFSGSPS